MPRKHTKPQKGNVTLITGQSWRSWVRHFLKGLPTVCDETRDLAGEVGRYVVELRRHEKHWHLAAITDRNARELPVPLKFLGKGDWKINLWVDAPDSDLNAGHPVKNEKTVGASDTLRLKLAPAGGTVAIFSPAK